MIMLKKIFFYELTIEWKDSSDCLDFSVWDYAAAVKYLCINNG